MDDPSTYYTPLRMSRPFAAGITVGGPAVALDGTPVGSLVHTGTTNSQSLTVGSNVNRALVALVGNDDTLTVSGIAYTVGSGGAWAKLGSIALSGFDLEIWYSVAPAVGAITAQATMSGTITRDTHFELYSLFNVDQTTPLDGYVSSSVGLSISTTLSPGGLVIGHLVNGAANAIATGTEDFNVVFNRQWSAAHNASSGTLNWTGTSDPILDICNVRKA